MGTNFYLKRKLSEDKKQELINELNQDNYEKCEKILYNNRPIHIGKRSYGWKFLWNANDFKYFKPTKDSLLEFLKSGEIVDEYGNKYTFDEFWNIELDEFLDKGMDLEHHYNSDEGKHLCYKYQLPENERNLFYEKHNIMPNKRGEFYIDNLRFTTETDFS